MAARRAALEALGLDPSNASLTEDDVKSAFKKRALATHPDKCQGTPAEKAEATAMYVVADGGSAVSFVLT